MNFSKIKIGLDQLSEVVEPIADLIEGGDVVILKGDIGAGKTTIVAQIALRLGIADGITSPTFAIVQTYDIPDGSRMIEKLIHVDTYRLDHLNEVYDLGIETLFDENAVTFIEWGEKIEDYIGKNHFVLEIGESNPDSRDFLFKIKGQIGQDRMEKVQSALLSAGWEKHV